MYKLLLHNIHSTPYSIAFADDGIFLVFKCWADDVALVSQAHAVKSELIAHEVDECSRFIRTFMPLPSNLNDLFQPKILFLHQYNHIKPTQMHTMHSKCLFLWDYIRCLCVCVWVNGWGACYLARFAHFYRLPVIQRQKERPKHNSGFFSFVSIFTLFSNIQHFTTATVISLPASIDQINVLLCGSNEAKTQRKREKKECVH